MIFSHKKLRKMANLNNKIKLDDIINAINSIGFEVESIKKFAPVKGIKFGKITKITKNKNADKLFVCEVEFNDKKRIIQTNATNVFENMIVIAFVPGSKSNDITFFEKELKGIVSEGMLSSLNEFGINKDLMPNEYTQGIQSYEGFSINDNPIEKLNLDDDLIDVSILTNRSDANSYIIMAKELAAFFDTKINKIKINEPKFKSNIKVKENFHKELALMEVKENPIIEIEEKILLMKHNIKIINNIVDLTNLTLIMTGQPTHAYDKELVGNTFSTIFSSKNVNILGNKEIKLDNNIVINSDDKDISLAGVMGFSNTSVSQNTKNFILEFGQFNIEDIRKNLKIIKIESNSGIQSSKMLSNGTMKLAIDYIKSKIFNFSGIINFSEKEKKQINFSEDELNKIAGFNLSKEKKYKKALKSLNILEFEFEKNYVKIPKYRHDINDQQDINEEILRFYGYDSLEERKPNISFTKITKNNNNKKYLIAQNYFEVMTYSLISKEKNIYNPFNFKKTISLKTFISKEREVIRDSQIQSIIEVIDYNFKRNMKKINIFSEGMINNGFKTLILASTNKNFKEIKNNILKILPDNIQFKISLDPNLHKGYSADIFLNDEKIGFIGKLNPKNTKINAIISEFKVIKNEKNIKFKKYDSKPLKKRDITFELKKRENINNKIDKILCFKKEIIDTFEKDSMRKITVRFIGTNDEMKIIDSKHN